MISERKTKKQLRSKLEKLGGNIRCSLINYLPENDAKSTNTTIKNQNRLLCRLCRELVKLHHYHNAWIVPVNELGKPIVMVRAGIESEFNPLLRHVEDDSVFPCGLNVLTTQRIKLINQPLPVCEQCQLSPVCKDMRTIVTRLETNGKTVGLIGATINASDTEANEEISIFNEIAGDISRMMLRLRVESVKKQSEGMLKLHSRLLDLTPDAIVLRKLNGEKMGKPVYANKAAYESRGYTKKEFMQLEVKEFNIGESAIEIIRTFRKLEKMGETVFETTHRCKDNSMIDVEINARIIELDKKKYIYSISRDITKRKQAERALRDSEEFSASLLNHTPNPVLVINSDTSVSYMNDAMHQLTGFNHDDIIGHKSPYPWWLPNDFEERTDALTVGLARGSSKLERECQKKNGEHFWVEITGQPVFDNKELKYFLVNWVDITERKKIEQQKDLSLKILECLNKPLKQREIIHQILLMVKEFSDCSAVAIRLKDGNDYPYYDNIGFFRHNVNKETNIFHAGEKRGGTKEVKNTPLGNICWNVINGKFDARKPYFSAKGSFWTNSTTDLRMVAQSEFPKAKSNHQCNAQGYESLAFIPLRAADSNFGLLQLYDSRRNRLTAEIIRYYEGLCESIGIVLERIQAERKRLEIEEIVRNSGRLASIGEMVSGLAHEINNPLTGVIGFSQLLLKDEIPKEAMEDIKVINDNAQRVANIVHRLLTFARQKRPERKYVLVNKILKNTLDIKAYPMKTNNLNIITRFDSELPHTMADPDQLQQVFINIINNAEQELQLKDGGGKITITTRSEGGNIIISFKDNGGGISKEHMEKIFDPFFTTREVGKGTGLGLSICHGIVTSHGGRIYVKSRLGRGTTFFIELPILEESEQRKMIIGNRPKGSEKVKAKVLVIDDEESVRKYLYRFLSDQGHEVETVASATDALARIKEKRYHLIMLDIKMPGMSGPELYHKMYEIASSLTRRTIFITGDTMGGDTAEFLKASGAVYLEKPFKQDALVLEVNKKLKQLV